MDFEAENVQMFSWLRKKPAPTVHAIASHLNWDFASLALNFIISQSSTDQATAAMLFFLSCPSNAFPVKSGSGYAPANHGLDEGAKVRAMISYMWQSKSYARGGVQYDPQKTNEKPLFLEFLTGETQFRATGYLPWPILQGIEGPFHGEKLHPNLEDLNAEDEEHLNIAALLEDLGTQLAIAQPKHAEYHKYVDWRVKNGFGEKPSWRR